MAKKMMVRKQRDTYGQEDAKVKQTGTHMAKADGGVQTGTHMAKKMMVRKQRDTHGQEDDGARTEGHTWPRRC